MNSGRLCAALFMQLTILTSLSGFTIEDRSGYEKITVILQGKVSDTSITLPDAKKNRTIEVYDEISGAYIKDSTHHGKVNKIRADTLTINKDDLALLNTHKTKLIIKEQPGSAQLVIDFEPSRSAATKKPLPIEERRKEFESAMSCAEQLTAARKRIEFLEMENQVLSNSLNKCRSDLSAAK